LVFLFLWATVAEWCTYWGRGSLVFFLDLLKYPDKWFFLIFYTRFCHLRPNHPANLLYLTQSCITRWTRRAIKSDAFIEIVGAFAVAGFINFISTSAFVSLYGIDIVFVIFDEVVHLIDIGQSVFFHVFTEGL